MIHHLYIVILVLRQLSFPLLSSQSYPRSAHRNGLIANSPFPNYLPPSGSFIVVSLSPYQNMYVHVHHIKASYENSSDISERTRLHSISVGHRLDVLGLLHLAAAQAVTVARNTPVSLFGERTYTSGLA